MIKRRIPYVLPVGQSLLAVRAHFGSLKGPQIVKDSTLVCQVVPIDAFDAETGEIDSRTHI